MNKKNVALTSLVKSSGCAAKLGPGVLHQVLSQLPKFHSPNLLVGYESSDDACVYKINENTVAIQTVDFFPPMVDDPYLFGQIAAANSLSDVYAMGGNPATAMNLMCFPSCLDISVMQAILEGGYSKVMEAGAVIAGGHTITDPTPKYGLCVTGFAHPDQILTNSNAQVGDVLILTKPIGLGIMNTANKAALLDASTITYIASIMATLNKAAKDEMNNLQVNACTDITGFSLLGHCYEMAQGSNVTIELNCNDINLIDGALNYASMGIIPEGMYHNQEYLSDKCSFSTSIQNEYRDLLFDPQTSGGLLLSLPLEDAKEYLKRMNEHNNWSSIIGQVTSKKEKQLLIY